MGRRHSLAAATLDALPVTVAILDEDGGILLTNRSWRTFDGSAVVEVVVERGLVETLNEHGAAIREFSASGGVVDLELDLPDSRSARTVFDHIEGRYDGVELLRYHERERPLETPQDVTARLESVLTNRQLTALQRAYYAGYFDWLRGADGDELAGTMDIARPTFHQHLRAARRRLLEELFGPTHTSEGQGFRVRSVEKSRRTAVNHTPATVGRETGRARPLAPATGRFRAVR